MEGWLRKKIWAWFTDGSAWTPALPEGGWLQHHSPSRGHPWRTVVKKNPPSGQKFEQYTWLLILPERRDDQKYESTLIERHLSPVDRSPKKATKIKQVKMTQSWLFLLSFSHFPWINTPDCCKCWIISRVLKMFILTIFPVFFAFVEKKNTGSPYFALSADVTLYLTFKHSKTLEEMSKSSISVSGVNLTWKCWKMPITNIFH